MTEYRCSNCGIKALPPPNQAFQGQTCSYCGGAVTPVLRPSPQTYGGAVTVRSYGWLIWVGAAVCVVVGIGVVGSLLLRGFGEPEVLLGRQWVPATGIATPITIRPIVAQRGRRVMLSMLMTDARGANIRQVRLGGRQRPSPPEVTIYDAQGSLVYRCRLSYG